MHALASFADADRDGATGEQLSRRAVRVVADPRAPWKHVRRALADGTAPTARIVHLRLTAGSTESIAVDQRRVARPGKWVKYDQLPRIESTLTFDRGRGLHVQLLDRPLGREEPACEKLSRHLKIIASSNPELDGELRVDRDVPVREVLRVLGIYRRAGIERTHLDGVPPEQSEAWLLICSLEAGQTDRIAERVEAMVRSPNRFFGQWQLRAFLESRTEVERERVVKALLRSAAREEPGVPVNGAEPRTSSEEVLLALAAIGRNDARVGNTFERVAADASEDAETATFARDRLHWFRPEPR